MSHRMHDLENTISVLLKTVNELATVKAHVCLGQGMHARGPWRSSATLNQARRRGTSSTMGSRKPFSPWTTYRANRQNAGLQQERSPDYEQHKRCQWHPHGYTVDNHMNNRGLAGNRDTWTQWETQEDKRGFNEHYEVIRQYDSCNTGELDRHAQHQQPCLASRTLRVTVQQEQPVLSGTHWSSLTRRQMSVVLCLRRFPMKIENCHIRHQRPPKVHQRTPR